MKITKLLLLGLSTLVFWGCSEKPTTKTETEYYKSDWIESINQYKWMEEIELNPFQKDKWVKHGWCKSYYVHEDVGPNHLSDSVLYDRGVEVESYKFLPDGKFDQIYINEIIECNWDNDKTVLRQFRILDKMFWKNGHKRWEHNSKIIKSNENTTCDDIEVVKVHDIGWYENGQKSYEKFYKEDGSTLVHDQWDENGNWNSGKYRNNDGVWIDKKSYDEKIKL